jgi:hypothetical protein
VKPGAIEVKKVEDVRKEPYNLPEGYHWCEIDINNPVELSEVNLIIILVVHSVDRKLR